MITDAVGRAVHFVLTPGQDHKPLHTLPLLDKLSGVSKRMVADRGYISYTSRGYIWSLDTRLVIPTSRNEETPSCPS